MLKIILVMSILFVLMACTGNTIKKQTLPPTKPQIDCQKLLKNKALRSKKAQFNRKRQTVKKPITQKVTKQKINTRKKSPRPSAKKRRRLTVEDLKRQIAQLGEKILVQDKKPNMKFADDFRIHKSHIATQYAKEWEHEIECSANPSFLESAIKRGLSKLRMDVAINANGTIYHMHITQSSGDNLLDDAARQIVKSSAPFAPLPQELLNELDVLIITRIWGLSDDTKIPPKNIIRKTPRKDINWWIYNRNRLKNN